LIVNFVPGFKYENENVTYVKLKTEYR